jgi:hypothetical protein
MAGSINLPPFRDVKQLMAPDPLETVEHLESGRSTSEPSWRGFMRKADG